MKKIFTGACIGIFISYTITLIISLSINDGFYHSSPPELIKDMNSEISAVILQVFLSAILGIYHVYAGKIFEIKKITVLKQTIIHFFLTTVVNLLIAYKLRWIEITLNGFIIYYLVFILIYFIIWTIFYIIEKNKINKINNKIKEMQE